MEINTISELAYHRINVRRIIEEYPHLIIEAHKEAVSYANLLTLLNISAANTHARKAIKVFLLDNNLSLPKYNSKGNSALKKLDKETILRRLVKSDKHVGTVLRKWVMDYDILPYACSTENCLLSDSKNLIWNGKKITLDLDHINGDNTDNRIENLRFLCPNCHSQTETYKGLNKRKSLEPRKSYPTDSCPECGGEKAYRSVTCEKCYRQPQKALYPPLDALLVSIGEKGFEAVGRDLGLSGNSLRKHLRRNDVDPKSLSPFAPGPKRLV